MLARFLQGFWSFTKAHKILGAILLLYGSTILIAAFGKALRVRDYSLYDFTAWQYLDFFRPEIFGGLGLILLVLSITTLTSRLLIPFLISYTLWFFVSIFEILGAVYFAATSDTSLDVSILLYSVTHFGELLPVFAAVHKTTRIFAFVAPVCILAIVYVSLYLKLKGERQCPWLAANRRVFALIPLAAVLCLYISMLPNSSINDRSYTQSFTYNILASLADLAETMEAKGIPVGQEIFPIKASLSEKPNFVQRNLVIVVLESTGLGVTSLGNSEFDLTPYLNELAQASEVYANTYTIVPHTSKALQGILCGLEPSISSWMTEAGEGAGIPGDCLAKLLAGQGYLTAFFQTATETFENRRGLVKSMGYANFFPLESISDPDVWQKANYFGLEDDAILPVSKQWLSEAAGQPFFATYLTLTPHHDYKAPDRYGRYDFVEEDEFNRYLNAIYYQDHFINNLIDQYKALGLYESTIFLFVGDHGEAFSSYGHGRLYHDTVIYNEGIQVPMLIHDPRNMDPAVRSDAVSVLDIAPTVLDKMGFVLAAEEQRGYKYGERNGAPVFTHCARVKSCMSIIKGDYKLIHHFGIREDELFRLDTDPGELNNLRAEYPEMAGAMLAELIEWRSDLLAQYRAYFIGQ